MPLPRDQFFLSANAPEATGALPHERIYHDVSHLRDILKNLFSVGKETVVSFIHVKSSFYFGLVRESGPFFYLKVVLEPRTHVWNIQPVA